MPRRTRVTITITASSRPLPLLRALRSTSVPAGGPLILYPSERYRGREIEISRVGGTGHRIHTGVHERTAGSRAILTAIFGSLPAGEYVVWEDADTEGPRVTAPDGAVAEVQLS